MSGGVDSTCCAIMLKKRYEVCGFFMHLSQPDIEEQTRRVLRLAEKLEIPIHIIDLKENFQKQVLDYFTNSYFCGLTPNPCVICNREIKFGLFHEAILERGMDKIATGHYARIGQNDGKLILKQGVDQRKDQSYFLCRLTQQQLAKTLFPLGDLTKEEVYTYAEANGFSDFRGRESQDVCFLSETTVADFLNTQRSQDLQPGHIVDTAGNVLGNHNGIARYTIGQRRGIGVSAEKPLYVVELDPAANLVIVGESENLMQTSIVAERCHWISGSPPSLSEKYQVKIRYTHSGCAAQLQLLDNNRLHIHFDEPQRAITPGQFAVIYRNETLIGSAEIIK